MDTGNKQRLRKPMARIRFLVMVLALTLVVFGIIGALVTLMPKTKKLSAPEEKGQIPQVRQLDRKTLQKGPPAPGS